VECLVCEYGVFVKAFFLFFWWTAKLRVLERKLQNLYEWDIMIVQCTTIEYKRRLL